VKVVVSFCVGCHNAYELWHKGTLYKKVAKRRVKRPFATLFPLFNTIRLLLCSFGSGL
jgi:hypothetical protein